MGAYKVSHFNAPGGGIFKLGAQSVSLPAGVTLQAIDGETMTSPTTMTNNFFARSGFTVATSPSWTVGKGNWWDGLSWDDPRFFAIGIYFGIYPLKVSNFLALKCPISFVYTGGSDPSASTMNANGIWSMDAATGGAPEATFDTSSCTGFVVDEQAPDVGSGGGGTSNVPAADQTGRLWYTNQTHYCVWSGNSIAGMTMVQWLAHGWAKNGGGTVTMAMFTVDIYWFGGSRGAAANFWLDVAASCFAIPMTGTGTPATQDQMARGCHYGNMVDVFRSDSNGTNPTGLGSDAFGTSGAPAVIPLGCIIESQSGSVGTPLYIITPAELNWGVWSSIIHGARFIDYFDDAGTGPDQIPAVNATQMAATNTLISQLAPVLNSPFALGFLTAVSPHGYLFPTYEQNWLNGGIEACAHWYQGGNVSNQGLALVNGFYIFATTRDSETVTGISATFTVASGSLATVIGESRSIAISGGQFTDTFANAWTVHIYQIS